MLVEIIIEFIGTIALLISVLLIYLTIKSNSAINQRILFANITKEERELRIKLQEYSLKIDNKTLSKSKRDEMILFYDTLLFNYYEFLAICLHKKLINKNESKLYFKIPLISVKKVFEDSLLFKKGNATKQEYPGIQWLFKKWEIN